MAERHDAANGLADGPKLLLPLKLCSRNLSYHLTRHHLLYIFTISLDNVTSVATYFGDYVYQCNCHCRTGALWTEGGKSSQWTLTPLHLSKANTRHS